MENRSNGIRALSDDECDSASGGVGWFVAIAVWAPLLLVWGQRY